MIKKFTLLAAAIAALAAFAVPATASAAEWELNGKPLEAPAEVTLTGPAGFTAGGNGAHADLHATLILEPGSTGYVQSLGVSNCTGTGGLTGLTCDATVETLPYEIHCNEDGTVTITDVEITNHYTPAGLAPTTTLTGDIKAAGIEGSLDHVTLSGEGNNVVDVLGSQVEASVTGTLHVAEGFEGYSCT